MTPEERFERIEEALQRSTELQAKQGTQIDKHSEVIDKHNEAIRSLIIVGRTCLDSIKEDREIYRKDHERMMAGIDKLREAQTATDEKLHILIDTVDRIIRHRENGKQ